MKKILLLLILACTFLSFCSCENENEFIYNLNLTGNITVGGDTIEIDSRFVYYDHTCDALVHAIYQNDVKFIEKEIIDLFHCQTYDIFVSGEIEGFKIKEHFKYGTTIELIEWEEIKYIVIWSRT
ncbi:hypothetical protein EZS27_023371 [termite gut metagenome]|jgi:hypothetical protein|uniref:Lipoprotein n=1 Tax=termite gut metagenome TaxID=433724 RepID=A0A5J4R4Y8_9ZZZZ